METVVPYAKSKCRKVVREEKGHGGIPFSALDLVLEPERFASKLTLWKKIISLSKQASAFLRARPVFGHGTVSVLGWFCCVCQVSQKGSKGGRNTTGLSQVCSHVPVPGSILRVPNAFSVPNPV